jgi:ceramide glucosyltransferase
MGYLIEFALYLFLALHVVSFFIAAYTNRRKCEVILSSSPNITLIRPHKGLEPHIEQAIERNFLINYENYELIFCVSDYDDPIIAVIKRKIAQFPNLNARLLIGNDDFSNNPKLNNMKKGFLKAKGEIIVFADSNLILDADYLSHIAREFQNPKVGLVTAPPYAIGDDNFASQIEYAFLNGYAARWQLLCSFFGSSFAQGKTLAFRRSVLENGGFEALANEPAEDAAATLLLRRLKLKIKMLTPLYPQYIGKRDYGFVWNRQLRWAKLRRASFPVLYCSEAFSTLLIPILTCLFTPLSALTVFALWYLPEVIMMFALRLKLKPQLPFAWAIRDIMILAVWFVGFFGHSIQWQGQKIALNSQN